MYKVYVDDNFHYQDESEPYLHGEFSTCEATTAACRRIVDEYLQSAYTPSKTANELWQSYVSFGEDPFISAPNDITRTFSAWDYARKRCNELSGPTTPNIGNQG